MAKQRQFLDKLGPSIRDRIEALNGDPDFVEFLLAWNDLLPTSGEYAPKTWPYWTTSQQRQKKRQFQKEYGPLWKEHWETIKTRARTYQPPKLRAGLFAFESSGHNRPGHPFEWKFWLAVYDVMIYFTSISGRPQWNLIACIFDRSSEIRLEWYRREKAIATKLGMTEEMWSQWCVQKTKQWMKKSKKHSRQPKPPLGFDDGVRLNKARRLYQHFKPIILKVLTTGIPIWAHPHRDKANILGKTFNLTQIFSSPYHKLPTKKRSSKERRSRP